MVVSFPFEIFLPVTAPQREGDCSNIYQDICFGTIIFCLSASKGNFRSQKTESYNFVVSDEKS